MSGSFFEDALDAALAYVDESGGTFIHPTKTASLWQDGDDRARAARAGARRRHRADPIGGGGLRSELQRVARARPEVRIVGVQAGVDGYTIADGIAVKVPSELTMPLLEDLLDDIVSVTDEEISEAIVLLLERAKLVVERSGCGRVAALLAGRAGGSARRSQFFPAGTSTRRCSSPSCAMD
jgi:threonine dehydratase